MTSANARDAAFSGGAVADDATDNASEFSAAYSALSPTRGGKLFLPAGVYRGLSFPQIAKNYVSIVGDGQDATIIKPTHSSGYLFDLQAAGKLHLEGLTIDGSLATGTAQALRLGNATSRNRVIDVCIKNFTNNGNQFVAVLEGSLDNTFYNVDFENNSQHLRLMKGSSLPANQNNFYGCKFQTVQYASGNAILLEDAEGNLFDGFLCQGNLGLNTITVTTTAVGRTARSNTFRHGWLEDNGNLQVGSHGFHVVGFNAANPVESMTLDDIFLGSSAQDKPSTQVYIQNTKAFAYDRLYANLGTPNKSIEDGTGNKNVRVGRGNNLAGIVPVLGPKFRVTKTPSQTITAAGSAYTKVTWAAKTYDGNTDFDIATNHRYTPLDAGLYEFQIEVDWESVSDLAQYFVSLHKNGAIFQEFIFTASGTAARTHQAEAMAQANGSTDFFELFVKIVDAGNTNRNVGTRTVFAGRKVE